MKILPCPTCGENKQTIWRTNYPGERKVVCNFNQGGCGTTTRAGDSDEEAITHWNRRPPSTSLNPSELANAML